MDGSVRHLNPNPTLSANFISRLFFCWLGPLFTKGHERRLEIDDMFNVAPQDSSDELGANLEREWMKEMKKRDRTGGREKPSLLKALTHLYGFRYLLLGFILFVEEGIHVVQPVLLGGFIRFFTPNSQVGETEAHLYALGVSLCAVVLAVAHHPYVYGVSHMGMQMRVACCSLMYKKALRLTNTAMGQASTGHIVNLMSNDVKRFDKAATYLHFLWIGPLQAIAVLTILWYELGPAVVAGFLVLLLLIPVQTTMGKLVTKFSRKAAAYTDERVKVMTEIISGMRVIKMYCWEKPFEELVEKIRKSELRFIWKKKLINAFTASVWLFAHRLLTYAVVLLLVVFGGTLRASPLYIAVSFMFLVAYNGIGCVFEGVSKLSEVLVAATRIQEFLLLDELGKKQPSVEKRPIGEDCSVTIHNLTAKWNPEVEQNTLDQISARVKAGQLLAIIGPVGAGKSSLLMAILGELQASSGAVSVKGKVAYVSQQAWVFSGSVRQNIIFGSPYEKGRFSKVVRASALGKDLEIMPHGDETLIGDRGVTLSGGQKARVDLARALYTDADIFLLDDPLSAVDARVGRYIFDKCIQGVLKQKARILVTHQLQYLTAADSILILDEGKVMGVGTYEELSKSGIDFAKVLKSAEQVEDSPVDSQPSPKSDDEPPTLVKSNSQTSLDSNLVKSSSQTSLDSAASDFEPEPVQLPEQEERQTGTVGSGVYIQYFKAGAGIVGFLLVVFVSVTAQVIFIMSDWWLSTWSNAEEERIAAMETHLSLLSQGYNQTNITIPVVDNYRKIYIFTGIIAAVFILAMARALLLFKVLLDASQSLYKDMFTRILRCNIGFFDTNPVGRILNRFTKDVGHMDDDLPVTIFDFVQCFLLILSIVLVTGVLNPYIFIPTVPIVASFFYIRHYYLSTSRSVKRLEGTCRSPVYSYLSASLQGLHTIRAFHMEDKCQEEFDHHQNLHSEAWFLHLTTNRWLAVRLDCLVALFVTAVAFGAMLSAGTLDAGLVGLSITYSMTLMGVFQWGVRQSAEVENQMVSVERVLEYSRLPSEAALKSEAMRRPPENWPDCGTIEAENVCLKYFPSVPVVLRNLTFRIKAKEKVGIVGRTGAGKSSLITCLLRLVEPTGDLSIDGIDILKLGLHDLRKSISIIPQDPVLFTGTLRKNLDPFDHYSDQQLNTALDEVQLTSAVNNLPQELQTEVSEGGTNFSVGQRQLICLARAILRQNRILLIDEATANVDQLTDRLIQETIRDKFRECTVLTIAHRLHTIMDSDRVMVLSDGRITEFEAPHLLLQRGTGTFHDMVQQTGKTEADFLASIAADAYARRRHDNSSRSIAAVSPADQDVSGGQPYQRHPNRQSTRQV